jgi:squalene synthase HpnC
MAPPVGHYENFPVASWLCPARLRPAVVAIYRFARTADDIADEGDAPAGLRLSDLADYRADLSACVTGTHASSRWPQVFVPLARALRSHSLPPDPLADLLSAFEQDVAKTGDGRGYADRAELLAYCRRSANPVGRLMLHLYGVGDADALRQSDCICTALQLINFWQDLSVDVPRGRYYLPAEDCRAFGLDPTATAGWAAHPEAPRLVAAEVEWARGLMLEGAPLARRVPGRAGWELRLVVQGGLRILEKIEARGFDSFRARPRLSAWDWPALLWRALRM